MQILVTSLKRVGLEVGRVQNPFVVSLLAPERNADEVFPVLPGAARHLRVEMDDITVDEGADFAPTPEHADELLRFFLEARGQTSALILHCMMGVSRSAAAAIGAMAALQMADGRVLTESSLAAALRPVREARINETGHFLPNRLLLRQFDDLLGADGLLVRVGATARYERHQGLSFGI